ncbi:hypothetical protein [Streptomyces sp. DT18]
MQQERTGYAVTLRGGPFDGKIVDNVSGDPMSPPDSIRMPMGPDTNRRAVYSPRVNFAENGTAWVYQFVRILES